MSIIDKVKQKFTEYGLETFNDYPIEDGEEHVFFVEDMVVFINKKENTYIETIKNSRTIGIDK